MAAPLMLVYGDSDMFRLEHAVKFYQLLGGGLHDAGWQRENQRKDRLAIIPDATHYDIFTTSGLWRSWTGSFALGVQASLPTPRGTPP
jgi:hypothetical protein